MKITLKAIADGVNEHKDELLFNKAVAEIKTAINDGRLLEAAEFGMYSYTVNLSAKPKIEFELGIKEELALLDLGCSCFCMHGVIQSVTIDWY